MRVLKQEGSSHLIAILAVVVLVVVGAVGYRVTNQKKAADTSSASPTTSTAGLPAKISSKADLQQASKALDAAPIKDNLNPSSLDSDLKNLL